MKDEAVAPGIKKKSIKNLLILSGILVLEFVVLINPSLIKEYKKFERYLPAATSTASVTVANVVPVASSASLNGESAITLTENATKSVVVTGTITDSNGCADLASVVVKVYKGLLADCTATDSTTCYVLTISSPSTDATCTGASDTDIVLSSSNATFNLEYYAQADSSWKATITPYDGSGAGTVNTSSGTVVNTLTALSVGETISYGTVANGADSTGDHTATVKNTGNVAIDYNLSAAADFTCTTLGSIPLGNNKFGTASFDYSTGGTALTSSPQLVAANIAAKTTTDSTAASYWQIAVPNGVSGTCSGSITFAAAAH